MLEGYDEILTPEEVCEILKIGVNACYNYLKSGEIKAFRNGRIWRIPKTEVIAFLRRKTCQN